MKDALDKVEEQRYDIEAWKSVIMEAEKVLIVVRHTLHSCLLCGGSIGRSILSAIFVVVVA